MIKLNFMGTETRKLPGTGMALETTTCSPPSLSLSSYYSFLSLFSADPSSSAFTYSWVLLLYKFSLHSPSRPLQFRSAPNSFSTFWLNFLRERERVGSMLLFKAMDNCIYNQSTLLYLHGYYFGQITTISPLN